MCGHAAALPPGISDGPVSAPSSPPETPEPTYSMPALFDAARATDRVREQAVAAVDQDVAGLEQRQQLRRSAASTAVPGLDQHHDLARPLQRCDELLQACARR